MSEAPPELPAPLGDDLVGLAQVEFAYRTTGGEARDISVTLFYPACSVEGLCPAPYAFAEVIPGLQLQTTGEVDPAFLATRTHAYLGAAISDRLAAYPLILFNHGYLQHEMSSTVLCSDLASCGYVVASVSHPGETAAIRYADGRICFPYDWVIERYTSGNAMGPELAVTFQAILAVPDEDTAELIESSRAYYQMSPRLNEQVGVWAEDTVRAVDVLAEMNAGQPASLFEGRLRLDLGYAATGHSFGGATAVQVCRDDPRCACGIDIDGGLFGEYYDDDIGKPLLTLGNPLLWKINRAVFRNNSADVFHLTVLDGAHMGFTDMLFTAPGALASRALANGSLGTRDPLNYRELVTVAHLRILETYLLGQADRFDDPDYENTKFYEKRAVRKVT